MKKGKMIGIVSGCIILLMLISVSIFFIMRREKKRDVQMPGIVFAYNTEMDDCLFVCNDGKILQSLSDEAFLIEKGELVKRVEENNYEDLLLQVGNTDAQKVQEIYNLFTEVVLDENYRLIRSSDWEVPNPDPRSSGNGRYWTGFYENEGSIKVRTFYETVRNPVCSDERAYIIVDWMNDVLSEYTDTIILRKEESTEETPDVRTDVLENEEDGDSQIIVKSENIYYKKAAEEDVIHDMEHRTFYVKNQLDVVAEYGTKKSEMEDVAEQLNAEIVGYIATTGTYQFEFKEDKTYDELEELAEYLNNQPLVSFAGLNYADELIVN